MAFPLQITAHELTLPEGIEQEIRDKAAGLARYYERIISCRVVIDSDGHHRKGAFAVRLDISVPGSELVVNRQQQPDLQTAVRDAFDTAKRQLEEHARKLRGE